LQGGVTNQLRWLGVLLFVLDAGYAYGQVPILPQRIAGSVGSGILYQSTETPSESGSAFAMPAAARFDLDGFVGHPGFLKYSITPWLNFGSRVAGIDLDSGNGVRVTTQFFRRRSFPLQIGWLVRQDGPSTFSTRGENLDFQKAGFSNRTRSFFVSGGLALRHLPAIAYSYGTQSTSLTSGLSAGLQNHSRNVGLALKDKTLGWQWHATYQRAKNETSLTSGVFDGNRQFNTADLRFDVGRRLGRIVNVNLLAAREERTLAAARDSTGRQISLQSRGRQAVLYWDSQAVKRLSLGGSVYAQGFETGRNLSEGSLFDVKTTEVHAGYRLHRDWSASASLSRSMFPQGTAQGWILSVSYQHSFPWLNLATGYSHNVGRQQSDQALDVHSKRESVHTRVNGGNPRILQWHGVFSLTRGDTGRDGNTLLGNDLGIDVKVLNVQAGVSRAVGRLLLDAAFTLSKNTVQNAQVADGFVHASSKNLALGVRNSRFQVRYLQTASQSDSPLFVLPDPTAIPRPRFRNERSKLLTGVLFLRNGMQVQGEYLRSDRSEDDIFGGGTRALVFSFRYQFRKLHLEAGYATRSQNATLDILSTKGRGFYFRFRRDFVLLER